MNRKRIAAGITALVCCAGMLSTMPMQSVRTHAAEAVNNDFEITYNGWHGSTMDVIVEAADGIGFGGSRGMTVTNRSKASDG
ncbi:MAG: hypothetical protein E7511_07025, partial [Ruminococcus sp.]|nr:hypothetical protein [Ruminococcus sp.]